MTIQPELWRRETIEISGNGGSSNLKFVDADGLLGGGGSSWLVQNLEEDDLEYHWYRFGADRSRIAASRDDWNRGCWRIVENGEFESKKECEGIYSNPLSPEVETFSVVRVDTKVVGARVSCRFLRRFGVSVSSKLASRLHLGGGESSTRTTWWCGWRATGGSYGRSDDGCCYPTMWWTCLPRLMVVGLVVWAWEPFVCAWCWGCWCQSLQSLRDVDDELLDVCEPRGWSRGCGWT